MKAFQVTIPADNKPGILAGVTSILSQEKINIRATAISSFGEKGFFNLIVDDPDQAYRALVNNGIAAELKEIIAVLIQDRPGGLDGLVQLLAKKNINIENAYGFVIESRKNAVFVLEVRDPETAGPIIHAAGFETLTPQALADIEPFHYMNY